MSPKVQGLLLLVSCCLVACSDSSTIAVASVAPGSVKATWDLAYGTDGPPIALDVEPLQLGEGAWASHEVVLRGAQVEFVVDLELESNRYRAVEAELIADDASTETIVRLRYDQATSFRVVIPEELPAGVHTFQLILPVWINATEPSATQPDDEITISLTYAVQSLANQQAVEVFCEDAVPLTNGRIPSIQQLDQLIRLSESELDDQDARQLVAAVDRLGSDLTEFGSGAGSGYNIGEVNAIIGQICNMEMLSEAVTAD